LRLADGGGRGKKKGQKRLRKEKEPTDPQKNTGTICAIHQKKKKVVLLAWETQRGLDKSRKGGGRGGGFQVGA